MLAFVLILIFFFFFNDTAPTEIYTLSLHDALPISARPAGRPPRRPDQPRPGPHPDGANGHPTPGLLPTPAPGTRTSRRTGERQNAHGPIHPGKLLVQESGGKRPTGIGRWIEAKAG